MALSQGRKSEKDPTQLSNVQNCSSCHGAQTEVKAVRLTLSAQEHAATQLHPEPSPVSFILSTDIADFFRSDPEQAEPPTYTHFPANSGVKRRSLSLPVRHPSPDRAAVLPVQTDHPDRRGSPQVGSGLEDR